MKRKRLKHLDISAEYTPSFTLCYAIINGVYTKHKYFFTSKTEAKRLFYEQYK